MPAGRGKAGGVKVTKSLDEAESVARRLLGSTLVTYQSGPEGQKVSRLLVEEGSSIQARAVSEHPRRSVDRSVR